MNSDGTPCHDQPQRDHLLVTEIITHYLKMGLLALCGMRDLLTFNRV